MTIGLWQTLRCRDADTQIRFLEAVGFTVNAVYRDEADPSTVLHAELIWPAGGGVMLGSSREDSRWERAVGGAGTYLLAEDPDAVHARALEAGAESVSEPNDPDYGGREASVRDPEGNLWSFGTYVPD